MENHLDLHNFAHQQRLKDAERERLAGQLRAQNAKPNAALIKLGELMGELMIEAGEHLQARGQSSHPLKQRSA
jgi:hypothetical protein